MPDVAIDKYIDAAKSASNRSRSVVLVLVTASIISFAAARNSRSEGWMSQRLERAQTALLFCGNPKGSNQPDFDNKEVLDQLKPQKPSLGPKDQMMVAERRKNLAKSFYDLRYRSCNDLTDAAKELEKAYIENSDLIHVPFFGLSFDINDLGLLSSVTFVVVLIWLRLCLESELDSVRVTFQRAQELDKKPQKTELAKNVQKADEGTRKDETASELEHAYGLLGAYQVFTRVEPGRNLRSFPKVLIQWVCSAILLVFLISDIADVHTYWYPFSMSWADATVGVDILIAIVVIRFLKKVQAKHPSDFWQYFSLGLYWLPVLVLMSIFHDNLASLDYGWSVSHFGTISQVLMEFLLLVVTWVLTRDCARIAEDTDAQWIDTVQKMRLGQGPPPPPEQAAVAR
jgi:hypothetical protein